VQRQLNYAFLQFPGKRIALESIRDFFDLNG